MSRSLFVFSHSPPLKAGENGFPKNFAYVSIYHSAAVRCFRAAIPSRATITSSIGPGIASIGDMTYTRTTTKIKVFIELFIYWSSSLKFRYMVFSNDEVSSSSYLHYTMLSKCASILYKNNAHTVQVIAQIFCTSFCSTAHFKCTNSLYIAHFMTGNEIKTFLVYLLTAPTSTMVSRHRKFT